MDRRTLLALTGLTLLLSTTVGVRAQEEDEAANPCEGQPDGTTLRIDGCSEEYLQCWFGVPVEPNPRCPPGLVFNSKAEPQGCTHPGGLGTKCPCADYYEGGEKKACNVCKKKKVAGTYRMPGNNKAFVACDTQKAFPQYCNAGLKWCQLKQECLPNC